MNSSTSIKHNPKGNGCPKSFRTLLLFLALALVGGGAWGQTTTYNSGSGNYTVPAGVSEIIVQVWGAGGGGGGSSNNNNGGSGGGGGGYARQVISVTPGQVIPYSVGAGGNAGAANGGNGGDGGATTFLTLTADGGKGGGGNAGSIGQGGSATGGAINLTGGNGAQGGGSGGDGGNGANGGNGGDGRTNDSGQSGTAPGGGGGGGERQQILFFGTNHPGGSGANGQIIISYTQPIFYSQGSGEHNNLSNWETSEGHSPFNMNDDYQTFVIQNGHTMTTTGAWTLGLYSSIQIEDGVLNEDNTITIQANGFLQVDDNGTLNHNVGNLNIFGGTVTIGAASTITYGFAGDQQILAEEYGDLTISGGGTKTILGNVRVNNNLSLTNGNISLGAGTNNLTIDANASITGTFGPTRMIVCDGDGSLIKEGASSTDFQMVYPVGTGSVYSPMNITSFASTGSGSVSVRVAGERAPNTNPTDLNRHWVTSTQGISGISADINFTFDASDVQGNDYEAKFWAVDEWLDVPGGTVGATSFSVAGASNLSGTWTAREPIRTYYSYQSGPWTAATTWTTDPSGTLSVSPGIPGADDRVVILNGRTVTNPSGSITVFSVQLNEGGTLDLGTTTGHNFGWVKGQGMLRLQTNNFPTGDFSEFVSATGGTVEYYNNANFNLNQLDYNNLIINLSTPATTVTLLGNLIVEGDLTIQQGTFRVNNNTATTRIVSNINGNVLVGENGLIRLGTGNTGTGNNNAHRIIIKGDFTNNGDVQFTNLTAAAYNDNNHPNNRVDVVFNNPSSDQSVLLNGPTRFYRIEINKGVDQTYILNIDATNSAFFNLWGKTNLDPSGTPPNIPNPQALGLLAGTLRLGENIVVPSIAETGVYNIDEDAMLWLDGANVTYSAQANTADGTAFIIYGGLRISSNSVFNDNSKQGLIMRTTSSLLIEDGSITTECVRTSYEVGTHRGAFTMSGGDLSIRAVNLPNLGGMNIYAAFTLPYPDNTLTISGGTINILSPNPIAGGSGSNFSYVVGANPNNISITGGEFNITVPAARDAYIASRAPFWNLNIISDVTNRSAQPRTYTANARVPEAITAQPLVVLNNLTLENRAVLTSGPNNVDVSVGNNFTINNNTTYSPGNNTTIFNGSGPQTFTYSGTITNGLNNLTLGGESDLSLAGTQATLAVRGNLELGSGTTLRDGTKAITVAGNISNSGTHYRPAGAAGRIELTGGAVQTISGNGTGSFNNLSISKSGGSVTLANPMTVNGDLRLVSNHRFSIGNNTLTLGLNGRVFSTAATTDQVFNANKMVVTNGLASDGGIKKHFSNTNEFLYPFGFELSGTYYYMPANIQFSSAPAQWGSVTSRPVNERHYLAQGATNAITTYWKNTSEGFSGITPNSVTHSYTYNASGANNFVQGNEANYIPAVYRSGSSWVTIPDVNQVDQANNRITFANQSAGSGEYTAGESLAFQAIPILYSSSTPTFWDTPSTWSAVGVGEPGGDGVPGPNTIVIIGDDTHNHTVTIQTPNEESGALFIAEGSMLDLGITQGHNFAAIPEETVAGAGTLRISSSNYFPAGDFGEFIGSNGGTVEFYSNAGQIDIPTISGSGLALNQFNNLILNHQGNIVNLPDLNLTIHDNITVKGSVQSARTNTGSNWTTLNVLGNFNVESGTFIIMNGTPSKTLRIQGDINVSNGATFRVRATAANTTHTLELHGDINNEGTFNLHQTDSRVSAVFKGTNNALIAGSGTTYNFYDITVDKGNDATPVVTLESDITTGVTNPFLTLTNGTFRVNKEGLTVTITDGGTSFSIPSTAALSVQNGDVRVAYGTGNLILAGKLEVLGGNMFIGNPATSNNNSIEYAAAGTPEIVVEGGNLSVNGQIRRPTTISSGSLNYIQSGGTTTIYGKSRINTRGLIEIANTNSLFSISGGTLEFDRPSVNGTAFGDIYIRPDSSLVTGGTLQMGLNGSTANHTFRLSSSSPLWNVSVGAVGSDQILQNEVLALSILNNLTINGNSQFNANGLNLSIGGSFTNNNNNASAGIGNGGFLAGSSTQTVTFNGSGTQNIVGNGTNLTNFANLTFASEGTVSLQPNSSLRVNGNLNLSTGILNDGGNTISVVGNITNTSTHTSSTVDGGLNLIGTQNQNLNGVGGTYGNIILNNTSGASLQNNATITGRLTFTNGSIYIDDYNLVFGQNASIGGTPDKTRMLILNGVLSDQGVRKVFTGASSFTFPIGVSGKYTPASYNISSIGAAGTITVRPINRRHPAVVTPSENELAYYWKVDSTGFDSNLTLTHSYTYDSNDAKPTVANYVVGLYKIHEYRWFDLGNNDVGKPGIVNSGLNSFSITNVGYLSGDFTAGEADNFTPPLETYYSRNVNGSWFTPSDWLVGSPSGAVATQAPNGNPVFIQENHTMTLNQDGAYSVSVEVIGTLTCGNTVFHDLGTVFGTGKIDITSTVDGFFVFPGGSFDEFFETTGTTVEFMGSNTASLPLKPGNIYKPYQNVIFSGTGQKNMSAENMRVLGNLTIRNGTRLNNTLHNKNLYISGSWINENISTNSFIPGTGTVFFEGSTLQNINVTARESFYNLTMVNTGDGAEIAGNSGIDIARRLTLTNGVLKSALGKEVRLTNTNASIAVSGGSSASYVDGPLSKRIINGQSFNFPVGNGGRLGRIILTNVSAASSPEYWTATYFNSNPDPTYPTASENLDGALTVVSNNEYWVVDRPGSGTANIRLRWDAASLPAYTTNATLRPNLRVVEFENGSPGIWTARGQNVSGTATSGIVSTTSPVTQDDYIFSIGAIGVTAAITDTSPQEVCDNEQTVTIPVELTGVAPWSLSYRVGATTLTENNINASPYNIQIRGSDFGQGVHVVELVSVSDASNPGVINPGTVTITVLQTDKPTITGPTTVGVNETRIYSTPDNGNTYLWSWVDIPGGGTIATPGNASTNITFGSTTNDFTLRVVETMTNGCSAQAEQLITVLNVPSPEISPTEGNLCEGVTITYQTTSNAGNQYRWNVTGGTCNTADYNNWRTVAQGGNSIEVEWSSVGNGSITVEERVGTTATQGSDTRNFVVYEKPTQPTLQNYTAGVCAGSNVDIVVENSEVGITYQLMSSGTPVGATIAGDGGSITLTTPELTTTTVFYVRAYNLGCEDFSTDFTANVYLNPVVNWVSLSDTEGDLSTTICEGDPAELNINYTVYTGNFSLEILHDLDTNPVETLDQTVVTTNPFKRNVTPVWDGVSIPPSTTYKYRVVITDEYGCESEPVPEASQPAVTVWKTPETGPQYHIPNTHGM
ncbi:beta strand repeat-containing protein [Perlabentimonas gracilis]|uniref:beta strand repeat-containing protein n=1 Tax=Perlabentimonas gracilis TaxID=2715279 RepID=UPI00140C174D|nr:hypothetical protein [Perlabentimonas gracilis]NHB69204.1 hypothetical protein [Perlabentimonas gracilis]